MDKNLSNIILTTDRLILRTWEDSDISLMAAISSDPLVMEHFPATQDFAATKALVDNINKHYKEFGYALYAVEIKSTHEFIGFVGLNHPPFIIPNFRPKGLPIVEIGWRVRLEMIIYHLNHYNSKANIMDINKYSWKSFCRGLFQLPIAA